MKFTDSEMLLLDLIKKNLFGIPISLDTYSKSNINWDMLLTEAAKQNVLAVALQNTENLDIAQSIVRKWRIRVFNQLAFNQKVMFYQNEIIRILNEAHLPYAVLKGSSLSAYYPFPELRMLFDIDLLFEPSDFEKAVSLLCEKGYKRRNCHPEFHEILDKDGIILEPHCKISEIPDSKADGVIKAFYYNAFEKLNVESLGSYSFNILSLEHQALSLLIHIERHLVENRLDLRRLCDWAMFISKKADNDVWAEKIQPQIIKCGLLKLAKTITKICVLYLGLKPDSCPWAEDADIILCEKLLFLILRNLDTGSKPDIILALKSSNNRSVTDFLLKYLNSRSKRQYPILKMFPILMPFVCLFILLRHLYETTIKKQLNVSYLKTFVDAIYIRKIYNELNLYKI